MLVSAGAVVAFAASLFLRATGSYYGPVDGWGVAGFEIAMAVVCLLRFRDDRWRRVSSTARVFPLVLGAGCLSWALGDSFLTALYGGGTAPVPSVADAFYICFFPLAYLGLMILIRGGNEGSLVSTTLNGLIAGLGVASLCAAYLFHAVLKVAGGSALSAATSLAYPVGDILLLTLAIGAMAVLPKESWRFLGLAGLAMASNAVGDLFNLLQPDTRAGYVANALAWPVALLVLAAAVWRQPPTAADGPTADRKGQFALPAVGGLAGMVILISATFGKVSQGAVGLATATLLVAGVRMALTVREGQALKSARFRSLIDNAWDIILVLEADLSVAYATPSSERVLGYTPAELQSRAVAEFVHPDDGDMLVTRLRSLRPGIADSDFAVRMRHRNGEWREIALSITNLLDDPSVLGFVFNGGDVTEARRAAEDLAAARDGAMMASSAKSQFLSMMSHEIRTPMNGVIGLTDLLLGTALNPEQLELASGIKVSAESLLVIINDILDFSKVEAGKMDLEEAAVDVPRILDDVGRILAGAAHQKGLELLVDVPATMPTALLGDAVRIQQIMLNLGSNAVKFTSHGEVVIRVMALNEDGDRVALRFEVIDMGIGIAPEDQKRLFQAFAQADSSTTRRFGGTGLGLAIVRQLVDLMGGNLGLISAPGEGSTFWFEISLRRDLSPPDPQVVRDGHELTGCRALIVDDNATNRRILRQQLLGWGIQSVEAAEAGEAIRAATAAAGEAASFDLAVIDLNMPGMDGFDLAAALKADPSTAPMTLFLLSSSGERLSAAECHLRGFAASLTKPARSSELFDVLISNMITPGHFATPLPVAAVAEPLAPSGTVLLVEDNETNRLVGSKVLSKLGFRFDVAVDGRVAVAAVKAGRYDAILMDCQMPEMDGYEATAEIRRLEGADRHTPIIAMTAAAMEGDREACLAAGMDDYITKPIRVDVVAATLERWINGAPIEHPGASTSAPDATVRTPLDHDQLDVLRSLDDGDGSILAEIVDQYLDQTATGREQIYQAASTGDAFALARAAHTIKGASANVGAQLVAEVCAQIESCGVQERLPLATGLLDRFDVEFARAREALCSLTGV